MVRNGLVGDLSRCSWSFYALQSRYRAEKQNTCAVQNARAASKLSGDLYYYRRLPALCTSVSYQVPSENATGT
jgi:hypothetical protein